MEWGEWERERERQRVVAEASSEGGHHQAAAPVVPGFPSYIYQRLSAATSWFFLHTQPRFFFFTLSRPGICLAEHTSQGLVAAALQQSVQNGYGVCLLCTWWLSSLKINSH